MTQAIEESPRVGSVGIVAIGRNEGDRLRGCLESLTPLGLPVVYADSGSTDGSPERAEELGATVWRLDSETPFSAARARREGAERLLATSPGLEYVFFVDGDCVVNPDWITTATAALDGEARLAAVCGRRRERSPEASAYNLMCDHEWDTPVGACDAVGGDAVYRVRPYLEAGGFDPTVPAGEEPELCQRLRRSGGLLERLDAEMTVHDAAITRFAPWWKRQVRTGYSGADVESRFGLGLFDRLIRGAYFWSLVYPLAAVLAASAGGMMYGAAGAIVPLVFSVLGLALQTLRIACRVGGGRPWGDRLRIAALTMLAKPAIAFGATRYAIDRRRGRAARLVEYKQTKPSAGNDPDRSARSSSRISTPPA